MAKKFDPKTTALLLLDLQVGFLERLPSDVSEALLEHAATVVGIARKHGIAITFVRAALTEEQFSQVPDHSPAFAALKSNPAAAQAMHPDSPKTQVHSKLSPSSDDKIHQKLRYGSFMRGPSMTILDEFRQRGVKTVLIGGVVTSGAVLSAVRQLADLDFQLVCLEDCCADFDTELHKTIFEKIFPKQAEILSSTDLEARIVDAA